MTDIRGFFTSVPVEHTIRATPKIRLRSPADTEGFTPSQVEAIEAICTGASLLVTGPAGTGKTFLIGRLQEMAEAQGVTLAVTAMTGVAAYQIGGSTLHSWAGVGKGDGTKSECIGKIKRRKGTMARWKDTDCLVIDEISMMTPGLLDTLDGIARHFRATPRAFGGMQVIAVGDFYQLPPVMKGSFNKKGKALPTFAFESKVWQHFARPAILREIVRQTDPVFQECLNRVRVADMHSRLQTDPDHTASSLLKSRIAASIPEGDVLPTRIYPNRHSVDAINRAYLSSLSGETVTYHTQVAEKHPSFTDEDTRRHVDSLPVNPIVELAVGAQVILAVNLDQERGLINGSKGVVRAFTPGGDPVVEFASAVGQLETITRHTWELDGKDTGGHFRSSTPMCNLQQIPLLLGWAITIHKSQGMSLDLAEVDAGDSLFECGQAYVALSRVRSLEGLRLIAFNPLKVRVHPNVHTFYRGTTPAT